jgi:hypothetical protein
MMVIEERADLVSGYIRIQGRGWGLSWLEIAYEAYTYHTCLDITLGVVKWLVQAGEAGIFESKRYCRAMLVALLCMKEPTRWIFPM